MEEVELSVVEREMLKRLLVEPRDNRWVQEHIGLGRAFWMLRRGWVRNPTGLKGTSRTNLWMLTAKGLRILKLEKEG